MKKRSTVEPEPSPRFISQPETIATLAQGAEVLKALNEAFYTVSYEQNPETAKSKDPVNKTPYESVALFSLDTRPTNRASTLLYLPASELAPSERLDFSMDSIVNRRVILSHTALGQSLKEDREPTFRTSLMNPEKQLVMAFPLVLDTPHEPERVIAAAQLSYTINQNPEWNYPGNDDLEKVWRSNKGAITELTRALGSLAQKTDSLSKKLEIAPPVTPNAYVIQWDIRNSTKSVLSYEYPIFEAYLEAWKEERQRITEPYNVQVLDRGEGEFIIIPFTNRLDVNSTYEVNRFGQTAIEPLVTQLIEAHARIAAAFAPHIFPRIYTGVGLGNVEEDQNNQPTGQVLWDVAKTSTIDPAAQVSYTATARQAIFGE